MFSSLLAALIVAVALSSTFAGRARASAPAPCGEASGAPVQLTLHAMRSSVLCLVNRVRGHYHLQPLAYNRDLRVSATRHSVDMVAHDYFAHDGPHGGTVDDRIGRAGYLYRVSSFFVGENIGGGVGRSYGSPLAIYRAWMQSPPHRANILSSAFHDFGVGVARGFPGHRGPGAATYTLDFGSRH